MHLLALATQDQPTGMVKVIERDLYNGNLLTIQTKPPKILGALFNVFILH
jgi:hypothetical protein